MYLTLVRICSNKQQIISLFFSSLPRFPFLPLLFLSAHPPFLPNQWTSSSLSVFITARMASLPFSSLSKDSQLFTVCLQYRAFTT